MKSAAVKLHGHIPPRYYLEGIKRNPLQRFWHFRRFKNIGDLIEPVDGEILDIGCADGTFTMVIVKKTKPERMIALDVVKSLIEDNKKRFKKEKKVKFMVVDATCLPFEKNRFDAIFCLEVLEHLPDPQKAVSEMKRVLRPGGYLIILVPTDSFLFKILWWIVLHTWGKHWQHTHVQSFNSKNTLSTLVNKCGLKIEKNKYFLLGMLNAVKAKK